tara:strand:- start:62 stop:196 length:135 start_codon:yes stop_codon:yes gene_type:complete
MSKEWKYTLILSDGKVYFANSIFELLTEMVRHYFENWKKGVKLG